MAASSSLPPQKFREIVFQLLYSSEFDSDASVSEMVMKELRVSRTHVRRAEEYCDLIRQDLAQIDAWIVKAVKEYEFDRIPCVEKAVLRLSMYELMQEQLPVAVVMAEAIRLTRKFATKEAISFVNAVLDYFHKEIYDKTSLAL